MLNQLAINSFYYSIFGVLNPLIQFNIALPCFDLGISLHFQGSPYYLLNQFSLFKYTN